MLVSREVTAACAPAVVLAASPTPATSSAASAAVDPRPRIGEVLQPATALGTTTRRTTRSLEVSKRGSTDGLTFIATDLDYSFGHGPAVTGRGVDLMMAMSGRTVALADLDGPGVDILRQRLD